MTENHTKANKAKSCRHRNDTLSIIIVIIIITATMGDIGNCYLSHLSIFLGIRDCGDKVSTGRTSKQTVLNQIVIRVGYNLSSCHKW